MTIAALRTRLARPASLVEVGGMRPPDDPTVSWFGAVHRARAGETWPSWQGRPMAPLAQLNLTAAPALPPALANVAMLTIFLANVRLAGGEENGDGWLLRAYPALDDLQPLAMPPDARYPLGELCGAEKPLKALPIRYTRLDVDLPDWDDVAGSLTIPEAIGDAWYEHFGAHDGTKVGGWPKLIQSEIFWAPWNAHPAEPEYAFQIGAEPKSGFGLPGDGMFYFGRGTQDARDAWAFAYQMG